MLKRLKALILGGPPPQADPAEHPHEPRTERKRGRSTSSADSDEDTGRLAHGMPGEFERVFGRDESDPGSWIGVDLDGTLSKLTEESDIHQIGPPIPEMVARVEDWIAQGYQVKILTARACIPEGIPPIVAWLDEHQLPNLEITNAKDLHMIEFWDDRGVQVIANTGQPVGPSILDKPPEEASPEKNED